MLSCWYEGGLLLFCVYEGGLWLAVVFEGGMCAVCGYEGGLMLKTLRVTFLQEARLGSCTSGR